MNKVEIIIKASPPGNRCGHILQMADECFEGAGLLVCGGPAVVMLECPAGSFYWCSLCYADVKPQTNWLPIAKLLQGEFFTVAIDPEILSEPIFPKLDFTPVNRPDKL